MTELPRRIAAENRKARFEYFIDETVEAGIMLTGTEVKSLRQGRANITDAYAAEQGGEIFLINAYIPEYLGGNRFNHTPRAPRKLLLHKREINRLMGQVNRGGSTLVPLSIYFNEKGRAKVPFCGNALEVVGKGGEKMLVMSAAGFNELKPSQRKVIGKHYRSVIQPNIKTIEYYGGGSARCMLLEMF